MINIAEAENKIKVAGRTNVRIVPMAGQSIQDGNHQVEVFIEGQWAPVLINIKKPMAESIVNQALNKVICG